MQSWFGTGSGQYELKKMLKFGNVLIISVNTVIKIYDILNKKLALVLAFLWLVAV